MLTCQDQSDDKISYRQAHFISLLSGRPATRPLAAGFGAIRTAPGRLTDIKTRFGLLDSIR
jgi:hypothetical protein